MLPSADTVHRRPRPPALSHKGRHVRTPSSRSVDIPTIHLQGSIEVKTALPETHVEEDEREVSIELDHSPSQSIKAATLGPIGLGLPSSFITRPDTSEILENKAGHGISPPPSYINLPAQVSHDSCAINTPPTQDVEQACLTDSPSRDIVETMLGPGQETTRGQHFESEKDMRKQLHDMQHQLNLRNEEINLAASIADKILHRHEELLAALPPGMQAMIPRLGEFHLAIEDPHSMTSPSSSSGTHSRGTTGHSSASQSVTSAEQQACQPANRIFTFGTSPILNDDSSHYPINDLDGNGEKRFFRTVREDDVSLPFPHHHHRRARSAYVPLANANRRDSFSEVQQQEAEERLARLEQELADARESEDAQRKVAVRLRRDFEKLQRDYDRAEEAAEKERMGQSISSLGSISLGVFQTPARKTALSTSLTERHEPVEEKAINDLDENAGLGWGSITFPQFPSEAGPATWRSTRKPGDSPSVESPWTRLPPLRPTEMHRRRVQAAARAKAAAQGRTIGGDGFEPRLTYPLPPIVRLTNAHKRRRSSVAASDTSDARVDDPVPCTPLRRARATAPSPPSVLSKLSGKVSSMRDYVAGSLRKSETTRPLSQELFESDAIRATPARSQGVRRSRSASSSASGRHIPSTTGKSVNSRPSMADIFAAPSPGPSGATDSTPGRHAMPSSQTPTSARHSDTIRTRSIKWADDEPAARRKPIPASMTFARQITPSGLPLPSPRAARKSDNTPARTPRSNGTPGSLRSARATQTQQHPYLRPLRLPLKQGLEPLVPILETAPRPRRPSLKSRPASDSFAVLALAHRRKFSSPGRELAVQIEHRRREQRRSRLFYATLPVDDSNFVTIPARVINDVIILLGLIMEWLEVCLAIAYRIVSEAGQGRRPNGVPRYWAGRKRYYL